MTRKLYMLTNMVLMLIIVAATTNAQTPPVTLRVATRIIPPFVIDDNGKRTGFSIDLWTSIADQLHLKSTYSVNASVAELLDSVKSGKADVGIAAISITSQRDKEFDFTQPMYNSGLQILTTARGGASSSSSNPVRGLFALLFSPVMLVWLSVALLLIVIPAHIVWLLERHHSEGIIPNKSYFPGIFHALWWAAGTLATQADSMPRNGFARVVAILWMFTSVVFVAYFTAQVTASLTVQQLQGNIKGPDDLPGKQVATISNSTSATYLREVNAHVVDFPRIEDAYAALLDGKVEAVVFDAPVLLYYASNEGKGKVQAVGSIFRKEDYGIVFPPNSPYRKSVDHALLTLRENGTYQKIYDKWFAGQ